LTPNLELRTSNFPSIMARTMSGLPTTTDAFFHGKVLIRQPKKGYRFAVDSPLLASFLPRSGKPALEVGCGVGVISLLALKLKKFPTVTGIELQDVLQRLAVENAAANGLAARFPVIRGDFKRIHAGIRDVQTVFCNPPFFKVGQGRVSPDPGVRLARFEIALTLPDLLRGCAAILAPRGKLLLVYPFSRRRELLEAAAAHDLLPSRFRPVRSFADSTPERLLVEFQRGARRCRRERPLVIFRSKGVYTREMERILAGE
jgi:tRNA1Val (adenine37-N6)-methyltransferase